MKMDPCINRNFLLGQILSYHRVMWIVLQRGFSINKILLDGHGNNLKNDKTVALRLGMFAVFTVSIVWTLNPSVLQI